MSYYYMLEFTAQCKVLLHDRPCMTHACHHKDRHTIKAAYRLPYHTIPGSQKTGVAIAKCLSQRTETCASNEDFTAPPYRTLQVAPFCAYIQNTAAPA